MNLRDDEGVSNHDTFLGSSERVQSFPDGKILKRRLFILSPLRVLFYIEGLFACPLGTLFEGSFLTSFVRLLLIAINEQIIIFGHQFLDLLGEG